MGGPGRQEAMMTAKRRFTDEEREQRRAQDRQRLKVASEQLLTSEGWQRWVRVRARGGLARLSLNNQLLVALACPDATFVAGFKAWLQLGYCPVKGSKAIRIMAPMPVRERVSQAGEKTDETRVLFKAVSVFDRVQVAAIDGVEQALSVDVDGVVTGHHHDASAAGTLRLPEMHHRGQIQVGIDHFVAG